MTTTSTGITLAGTYHFPLTRQTGVKVIRDDCSVVVYPMDLPSLQARFEADDSTGVVDFHGVTLDESDVASIRAEMIRLGIEVAS